MPAGFATLSLSPLLDAFQPVPPQVAASALGCGEYCTRRFEWLWLGPRWPRAALSLVVSLTERRLDDVATTIDAEEGRAARTVWAFVAEVRLGRAVPFAEWDVGNARQAMRTTRLRGSKTAHLTLRDERERDADAGCADESTSAVARLGRTARIPVLSQRDAGAFDAPGVKSADLALALASQLERGPASSLIANETRRAVLVRFARAVFARGHGALAALALASAEAGRALGVATAWCLNRAGAARPDTWRRNVTPREAATARGGERSPTRLPVKRSERQCGLAARA